RVSTTRTLSILIALYRHVRYNVANNLIRPHVRSRTLNVDWYNHLAIEGTNHALKRILIVHQNVIVRLTPLHFLKRTLLLTFFHTFINPQHFRLSQLLPFLHWRLLSADISVLHRFSDGKDALPVGIRVLHRKNAGECVL